MSKQERSVSFDVVSRMQQNLSASSSPSFCVREQKAIALIAAGADHGDVARVTGLSFTQIVDAWLRRAQLAETGANVRSTPRPQRRASCLML